MFFLDFFLSSGILFCMKQYVVKYRVWNLGEYSLKKDDVVTATYIGDGMVVVDNSYFTDPVTTTIIDLNSHCDSV